MIALFLAEPMVAFTAILKKYRILLALGLFLSHAPFALAHPLVDQGKRLYEEADFSKALDVLDRAESLSNLTRKDLVEELTTRALVYFAMGQDSSLQATLVRLASLEPNAPLPKYVPPPVRERFESVRKNAKGGAVKVVASAQRQQNIIAIKTAAHNDAGKLIEEIRIYTRSHNEGWRESARENVEVPIGVGIKVEYYAEAIGPGGAVIATDGTKTSPKFMEAAAAAGAGAVDGAGTAAMTAADSGGGVSPWLIAGIAGVAVAAAVVIYFIVKGNSSEDTQIGPPTVQTQVLQPAMTFP